MVDRWPNRLTRPARKPKILVSVRPDLFVANTEQCIHNILCTTYVQRTYNARTTQLQRTYNARKTHVERTKNARTTHV